MQVCYPFRIRIDPLADTTPYPRHSRENVADTHDHHLAVIAESDLARIVEQDKGA